MTLPLKPVLKKSALQTLIALLALIAIGVGIGFIPWPVSSDRADQEVRKQISASVGEAEVSIGPIRLSLLPYPRLLISDFKILKQNKFSAASREAQVSLSLTSLVAGDFKPTMFRLIDPMIELPADHIPSSPSETAELAVTLIKTYPPETAKTSRTDPFKIRLVNGTVTGASQNPNTALRSLSADLTGNPDGSLGLVGETVWHGQKLTVAFSADAATSPDVNARQMTLDVATDLGRFNLSGELNTGMFPHFEGRFDSTMTDARKMSEIFGLKSEVSPALNLSITGASKISREGIIISQATVSLGGVKFSGGLNFRSLETRPQIVATLATEEINATELLRPYWPKSTGGSGWRQDRLDKSILPALDLDLRVSAERADLGVARVSDVAVSLLASDGKLDATLASAKVFNGSVKARLIVAQAVDGLTMKLHGSFDRLDSGTALLSLMNSRYFEGVTSGAIAVESSGNSAEQIMQNLSGTGEFDVENGTVAGINVAGIMKKAETRPLSLTGSLKGGTTEFDTLALRAVIANGEAQLAEAAMRSPDAQVTMTGLVDIGKRKLDLQGEASRPEVEAGAQMIKLPFTITGSFDAPTLKPDIEKMLRGPETQQD
jgi:AsmA protein